VPKVSISRTVRKPLLDSLAADAKKFPAAPLTKISIFPNYSTNYLQAATHYYMSLTSPVIAITFPDVVRACNS
jgi:hypothetical protein